MKTLLLALLLCVPAFAQYNQNNFGGTSSSSGSGTGAGAQPILGITLSPNCPAGNTGYCFQTSANTQINQSCSWSNASTTITCPANTFTAADAGKTAWGFQTTNPFLSQPAGGSITATHVTISTFTDNAHVVISATPANTCASNCSFIWGTPDDAAAVLVDAAMASAQTIPFCPRIMLAAANYMFTTPHFTAQPAACAPTPPLAQGGSLANLFYSAGFELEGRGADATILWIPPDFPESGSCTNSAGSSSSNNCFVIPLEGRWSGLQITCGSGGCNNAGNASGTALIGMDVGSIDYVTCTGWGDLGSGGANRVGLQIGHWAQGQQVNLSACGDTAVQVDANAIATFYRLSSENANPINSNLSGNLLVKGGANFTCFSCKFFGSQSLIGSSIFNIQQVGASTINLYDPLITEYMNYTTSFGYICITTNGCILNITGGSVGANNGTNASGLGCNVNCTINMQNLAFLATGTGHTLSIGGTGSSVNDRGGNTNLGSGTGINPTTAAFIADGHSLKGTCTGVVTAASTLGLYGTGPNETTTTCTSTTIGSGQPTNGSRTLTLLTVTATAAGVNASSGLVSVVINGTPSATAKCTIGTGTSCSWTGAVTLNDGDLVSLQFTTQTADTLAGVKAVAVWQ